MPTDKAVVEEHKSEATVVFDDSMKGKKIDAIDKRVSVDFEDEGRRSVPVAKTNLMCKGQRSTTEKFRRHFDEIAWMCDDCGKMHPKGEDCVA